MTTTEVQTAYDVCLAGRLLCRAGFHGYPRSQGEVGYCPRGCGNLKRVHNAGAYWTRYVEPPSPDSRPPVGLPRFAPGEREHRGEPIPSPSIRFSVSRADALHTLRLLYEVRSPRINVRIERDRAYFTAVQVLAPLYAWLDSAGVEYRISGQ